VNEEKAFLSAILADPDDDAPRLVFADWLEERGDPRGEFIRGQCRLARMRKWDDGYTELETRCGLLERTHRDAWLAPITDLVRDSERWWERSVMARGFPEVVVLKPEEFPDRLERQAAHAPIRGVVFTEPYHSEPRPGVWRSLVLKRLRQIWFYRAPAYRGRPQRFPAAVLLSPRLRVTNLGVSSDLVERLPGTIAEAPFAPQLHHLELTSRAPSSSWWCPLWRAKTLRCLRRFAFRSRDHLHHHLDLGELTSAPWFAGLEWLKLAGSENGPPLAIPDLGRFLGSGNLLALSVGGFAIPEAETQRLRTMPEIPLQHLDLGSGRGVGRKVLRALIRSPGFRGLRSFALTDNGNVALSALSEAPMRDNLRVLRLGGHSSGLLQLARSGCPQLRRLEFRSGGLQEDKAGLARALGALLDPDNSPRLVSLGMAGGLMRGDLVRLVAGHPGSTRLKELRLSSFPGPDEARILSESRRLSGLTCLRIQSRFRRSEEREAAKDILLQRFGPRLQAD
jgi:uncharacterized protein (TIGR02996 family)